MVRHASCHQIILFKIKESAICQCGNIIAHENQKYRNISLLFDFEYSKQLGENILTDGRKNQRMFCLNHAPHVNFKLLEKTGKNL